MNRTSAFNGLFRFGNAYSTVLRIKHVLALGRQRGPSTPAQERSSAGWLSLNVVLSVLTLLFSGFSATLSASLGHMAGQM